ncbi:MAG TPA: ACT domain-containing protein [Planctomycetes bacterium]|nr:ACT domain-containing protein [Planctomycetota bacterium]
MNRRFLTAEDVRRHAESTDGDLVVEPNTVVTPQAAEAAEARGLAIRTTDGNVWTEPAPDRGPDAARAVRSLPHLPEPEENPELASTAIVTAVGRNRPGVLAEITAAVAELGGNVHDVSQKVVDDFFHIILTVQLGDAGDFGAFKESLECMGRPDELAVRVMNERVFRFMHRV